MKTITDVTARVAAGQVKSEQLTEECLIKIAELATVTPDVGMFALGALIGLLPAIMVSFDPEEIWQRVEWADGTYHPKAA